MNVAEITTIFPRKVLYLKNALKMGRRTKQTFFQRGNAHSQQAIIAALFGIHCSIICNCQDREAA